MTAVEMITREIDEKSAVTSQPTMNAIVVATDGSDSALSAFHAAALIRAKTGAAVHVLSVLEPVPVYFPASEGMLLPPDFDESREEAQRAIIMSQMSQFPAAKEWTLDVRLGRPGETIAEFARDHDSGLIIIGTNKHGIWGRILGEETATEIARLSDTPLLIASAAMARLPKRVVVAMDLNPNALKKVPQSLGWIADEPTISCVHVKPRSEFMGIDWADFDNGYELAMKDRFSTMEKAMAQVDLRPELVVLHGDAAHEITDYATYSKAELIVVGVKRRRGRARALGGRMAGRVVRQASSSVLIVPSIMSSDALIAQPAGTTDVVNDSRLWSTTVRDFTARNAGRIVCLEVNDPEIGALVEASHYPLLGVDYDHRDNSLLITLGDSRGLERHLTRTISKPQSISVLSVGGRDTALAVSHGGGQTLLTF